MGEREEAALAGLVARSVSGATDTGSEVEEREEAALAGLVARLVSGAADTVSGVRSAGGRARGVSGLLS